MDSHVTFTVKRSWLRTALVVAITAMVVAPVAVFASHRFGDVDDSNVFHDDITWMADNGITFGCNPPDNDLFCPDDFVTREQLAATLHRMGALRNYETVTVLSASDSTTFKNVSADCPPGKLAVGGGARVAGVISDVALTSNGPDGFLEAPTSWLVAAQEIDPTDSDWVLRVDVICADI